ncbi:uncharacterized protein BXZ73DRAFT_100119 [Epithele typhae]|uniref:uncharacterized protein n=1 Tax=Epithele typhae TaxID=378194 RepID=UPI0020089963|nr:uncharacterized protein BXZ73DRAFT_100119 [Epithele typhae]KAH9937907.1 hypothetical protein BXZ73DRAFT_100119 [Epithele typhae]
MSGASDYTTRNYPPENDTTSSGGFSAQHTFAPQNQRRADHFAAAPSANPNPPGTTGTGLVGEAGRDFGADNQQVAEGRQRGGFGGRGGQREDIGAQGEMVDESEMM